MLHIFIENDIAAAESIKTDFVESACVTSGEFKGQRGAFVSIPLAASRGSDRPLVDSLASRSFMINAGPAFPPDLATVKGIKLDKGATVWTLRQPA